MFGKLAYLTRQFPTDDLRGLDTFGRFFTVYAKGDKFCDFLFDFLHVNLVLIRDLL